MPETHRDDSPLGPPPRVLARVEDHRVKAMVRSGLFGASAEPARVGPFVVLRLQGTGATGSVYAAYDERLDRKVAIKLLRSDDDERGAVSQRLLWEARALARLAHPNVVAVHEVGSFEGKVFIAMEFVEGPTLHAWLAARRRRWPEVVANFRQAACGLAAAHAAGLTHRDFKPANVLVGKDGRVRVLDFGLVCASGEPEREPERGARAHEPALTASGACMGTPCYMAPEQLAGRRADARSDQFSFCVALYEGLYGQRPFAGATLEALTRSVSRGVLEPPPPGSRVPGWLRRVVLRGLAVAPEDRWPSMEALLQQLGQRPLRTARRWLLAAALGLGFAALQAAPAPAACGESVDPFADIWDEPRRAAIEAAFLASGTSYAGDAWLSVSRTLDAYTDEWRATRRAACEATLVARNQSPDLMDLRIGCLERRRAELAALSDVFAAQPVAPASLLQRAAAAAMGLQRLDVCSDVAALRGVLPPPPPLALAVADLRRQIAEVRAREQIGEYQAARAMAVAATARARTLAYPPVLAEALYQRGRVEHALGEGPRAAASLEEAGALAEAVRHDHLKAEVWSRLVRVASLDEDDPEQGQAWARLARGALARVDERGAPLADAIENEALALHASSRFGEALAGHREALQIRERVLGASHLKVADSLNNLANTLGAEGQHAEALALYERAIALQTEHLGPRHPDLAITLFNVALQAVELGRAARAEETLALARSIDLEVFGADSRRMAQIHLATALLREQGGAYEAALGEAEAALRVLGRQVGEEHSELATALSTRGTLRFRLGQFAAALQDYTEACAIWRRSADLEDAAMCESDVGETLLALARPDAALLRFIAGQAQLARVHAGDHPLFCYPLKGEGQALLALGRPADAVAPLRRAWTLSGAGEPRERAEIAWALALALDRSGARDEAVAHAQQAREGHAALNSPEPARLAEIDAWLRAAARSPEHAADAR